MANFQMEAKKQICYPSVLLGRDRHIKLKDDH